MKFWKDPSRLYRSRLFQCKFLRLVRILILLILRFGGRRRGARPRPRARARRRRGSAGPGTPRGTRRPRRPGAARRRPRRPAFFFEGRGGVLVPDRRARKSVLKKGAKSTLQTQFSQRKNTNVRLKLLMTAGHIITSFLK